MGRRGIKNFRVLDLKNYLSYFRFEKLFGGGIDEQNPVSKFSTTKSQNTPPEYSVQTLRRAAQIVGATPVKLRRFFILSGAATF